MLSRGEGLALHRRDAPVTGSTLAMAMVPAVVSGVLGYLPEILSGGSGSHKTNLIREDVVAHKPVLTNCPPPLRAGPAAVVSLQPLTVTKL